MICKTFQGKLSTVCLLFCYGLFEVSILRSLDTRRFLKCRMTVSYFGFIFFRDHRERVIVASSDKRVKLKYPFAQT